MVSKLLKIALAHKLISATVAVSISLGGYFAGSAFFGGEGETRYILAAVRLETVSRTIVGSGQIVAGNQVDLKSKVSGEALYVRDIKNSQVWPGTIVVQLDNRDAERAVRDAEASLESAKLALERLKGSADLAVPKNQLQAEEDLKKAYDDGFNNVANVFLELPGVMSGLETILYGRNSSFGGGNQDNLDYYAGAILSFGEDEALVFKKAAAAKYQAARKSYDKNFTEYKSASRFWPEAAIESLIEATYETTKLVAESVKSANNLIQFYEDQLIKYDGVPAPIADTYLANLTSHTATTNKHLLNLLSVKNTIQNSRDAIANAGLDIRVQELAVRQKENALLDAQEKLADYYIRAPFTGMLAKINIKRLDSVGNGAAVATLINHQKEAEISLNEVDAALIKLGQKAKITFDAVEGLALDGVVSEMDILGTVSQGVVTYNISVTFETDDVRVKPGMSVSAAIVIEEKQNVLAVPNSAVKSRGNLRYVETSDAATSAGRNLAGIALEVPPREQIVTVGLSDDAFTEIVSGLSAGERVVVRTVVPASAKAPTSAPSIFGSPAGGNRAASGGGGVRFAR